jgi:hypothetical protein
MPLDVLPPLVRLKVKSVLVPVRRLPSFLDFIAQVWTSSRHERHGTPLFQVRVKPVPCFRSSLQPPQGQSDATHGRIFGSDAGILSGHPNE